MLGHGFLDENKRYALQTIKDNVGLLTEEVLCQLNIIMINHGHGLLGATDKPLLARCDSFVVERNVHFPTDISLLFDALCKAINLTAQSCKRLDISDWRQSGYNMRQLKKALRKAQQSKTGCLGAHNRFWDFQVSQNRIASLGGLFFWAARLPLKQASTKTTYSSSPSCSCMPLRRENIASSTDLLWRLRHGARWE